MAYHSSMGKSFSQFCNPNFPTRNITFRGNQEILIKTHRHYRVFMNPPNKIVLFLNIPKNSCLFYTAAGHQISVRTTKMRRLICYLQAKKNSFQKSGIISATFCLQSTCQLMTVYPRTNPSTDTATIKTKALLQGCLGSAS